MFHPATEHLVAMKHFFARQTHLLATFLKQHFVHNKHKSSTSSFSKYIFKTKIVYLSFGNLFEKIYYVKWFFFLFQIYTEGLISICLILLNNCTKHQFKHSNWLLVIYLGNVCVCNTVKPSLLLTALQRFLFDRRVTLIRFRVTQNHISIL